MVAAEQLNEKTAVDTDYWLAHCEGYTVESSQGRVGLVEEVRRTQDGRADNLAVLAGMLGRRRLIVPVSEVALIAPRTERITVRSPIRISGSEPLPRGRRFA
jgi:hypothetical protein